MVRASVPDIASIVKAVERSFDWKLEHGYATGHVGNIR